MVSEPDADLIEIFRDEAAGRLDEMDAALLVVESGDAGVETVDSLFRNAHTIKGTAGMLGLPAVSALAHAIEDVLASVRDAGFFRPELAAPLLRASGALRAQVNGGNEPAGQILAELAASREAPSREASCVGGTSLPGTSLPATGLPATGPPGTSAPRPGPPGISASAPQPGPRLPGPRDQGAYEAGEQVGPASQPRAARQTLRVPAKKIDHLIDVVSEVMQYRRRLAHSLGAQSGLSQDIADEFDVGERMLEELTNTAVELRTLPLASITRPLPRAVREIARGTGKDVDFLVTGAETELDRVILESLSEPLAQLLRNAVIHGIESPAERELAHKPPRGRVEVRAVPRGSLVEIVVADDGRGISPEVIEEARREGSLADVLARPGYSTAAEVTDLAGRGVGLDAVKAYVRSLGGSFEIRSKPGRGMEVILLLPLSLAVMEVLLFERAGAVYGVPLAVVDKVVMVTQTLRLEGRPALEVQGRPLPVADIAALLGAAAPPLGNRSPALVISAGGRQIAVTCDVLLGQKEVMVKPLGPLLAYVEGYLGTAVLGDGRIALLVDPASLTQGRRPKVTAPPAPGPAGPPKILIVEDSFSVRELQRSILEAAGYPVVTARNGRDALDALGADPEIALVITDVDMPELDGLDLTRAIRADTARSALPVVIVTSRGSDEDRRKGLAAGADAYMAKRSFDQQSLLGTVERLVGR